VHSEATLSVVAQPTAYRPDIDGMRALAITCVVAYHVGLPGFGGGFIGVDVFFVISGYLITNLLLSELRQRGSINLPAFFARRVRRLFPAFFIVTAATLLLGSFFLVPVDGEQQSLADTATAAALYVSNLHFAWLRYDYFDPSSKLNPLLHTWSLAIEEQFYLLWPLIMLGVAWAASRWRLALTWALIGILSAVLAVSLSYSWWAAAKGGRYAEYAFFAPYSRAWELGVGALLALALPAIKRSGNWAGALLTAVGIFAIGAAALTFHNDMPFPGTAALLPVLGTAAVITGVWIAPRTAAAKLLGCQLLVAIGLISYSWYLWHWPLLAIARAHELGVGDLWRDGGIAMVALGLAWLTYVFVEQPIRSRRVGLSWSDLKTLGAGAAASLLVIAGAGSLHAYASQLAKTKAFEGLIQARQDVGWSRERCRNRGETLVPRSRCVGNTNPVEKYLVIWGDSHADHSVGMFETANASRQVVLLPRWMSGCPPLIGVVPLKRQAPDEACNRFNSAVLAEIDQLRIADHLAGVVLGARWPTYLGKPSLIGEAGVTLSRNGRTVKDEAAAAALEDGLYLTLRKLAELDIKVLVIAPMPEQRFEVPSCLARHSPESCSVSRVLAEHQRRVALQTVKKSVGRSKNVYLWDPLPALCEDGVCLAERDGFVMYRDDDHLTTRGSRWLGTYLARSAAWLAMIGSAPWSALASVGNQAPAEGRVQCRGSVVRGL
jgi:peptidoglycan/LPS O-acetylase OafA/YrhL